MFQHGDDAFQFEPGLVVLRHYHQRERTFESVTSPFGNRHIVSPMHTRADLLHLTAVDCLTAEWEFGGSDGPKGFGLTFRVLGIVRGGRKGKRIKHNVLALKEREPAAQVPIIGEHSNLLRLPNRDFTNPPIVLWSDRRRIVV